MNRSDFLSTNEVIMLGLILTVCYSNGFFDGVMSMGDVIDFTSRLDESKTYSSNELLKILNSYCDEKGLR